MYSDSVRNSGLDTCRADCSSRDANFLILCFIKIEYFFGFLGGAAARYAQFFASFINRTDKHEEGKGEWSRW